MSRFIRKREVREEDRYYVVYNRVLDPASGFMFESDRDGNVNVDLLHPVARENYNNLVKGETEEEFFAPEVVVEHCHIVDPAVIECDCGREVALWDVMTNSCECGREYNGSGQLLAPREFWGEETGETLADIFSGRDE